jgi:tetratricopeptide (TPR) repeat protein
MRHATAASLLVFVVSARCEDPPVPLPVLPATVENSALLAALQLPLQVEECRVFISYDGRYDEYHFPGELDRIDQINVTLGQNATDAERYDELWRLQYGRGNAVEARVCAAKAAECYRRRLTSRPDDAAVLTGLGEALINAGEPDEAEPRLRESVAAAPHGWRAWFLLARIRLEKADAIAPPPPVLLAGSLPGISMSAAPSGGGDSPNAGAVVSADVKEPERSIRWHELRKLSLEAECCLARAFEAAPHEPAVLFARTNQRKLAAQLRGGYSGWAELFSVRENLADIREAVTPDTTDPAVITIVAGIEIAAAKTRPEWTTDAAFRRQTHNILCERIEQLESIAATAKGPDAARTALYAARLSLLAGQPLRSSLHIGFAVIADPDSWRAQEVYLAVLRDSGLFRQYLSQARRVDASFNTYWSHLWLADALSQSGNDAEAMQLVIRARKDYPTAVHARLAELVLKLKIDGPKAVASVNEELDRVEADVRPYASEKLSSIPVECELLRACAQIVGGNAVIGRVTLEDLARRQPDHPRIKAALAAVE